MQHFICYHNPERMGYSAEEADEYSLATSKPVERLLGNKVWLITGVGKPRQYYLCSWFIVDNVGRQNENALGFRCFAESLRADAQSFDPLIRLDELPWFNEFKRTQGNFGLGVQKIASEHSAEFEAVASKFQTGAPTVHSESQTDRSLFRRFIECCAVKAVRELYETRMWTVVSRESEKCGYDLLCKSKEAEEHHVEVKGLSSREESFVLTANELKYAQSDSRFRLLVVTLAHIKPNISIYTADQLKANFYIEPTAYRVKPRR